MGDPLHPGSSLGQLARFVKSSGTFRIFLILEIEANSGPTITFLKATR